MRAKLILPIGIAVGAALLAQLEGTMVTLWAADRSTACTGPVRAEGCALNSVISFVAGTFFAVETFAATLVGLVLLTNGKRRGAIIAAAGLATALFVEHVWLLT
jgi:UPF0716 family protein affecting phage T7 exclusion